jgi:ribonuclease P protein component
MLAPNEGPLTRLGITASKKVGNSVVRSKAKRIVREAFRTGRHLFPEAFDLVVICRSASHELSPQQAIQEWQLSASRIKKAAKKAKEKVQSGEQSK